MLSIRKILCTTDFSDPSYKAVRTADEMARHFGAELIVVHVANPVPLPIPTEATASTVGRFDIEVYKRMLKESVGKELEAAVENACESPATVRRVLLEGNPADEIVAFAKEEEADLIVISTHGHTGFRRFVTGSVTEKVVRTADRPVLTVHMGEKAPRT